MMFQSKRSLVLFVVYSILLIIPSVIVGYQLHALWPPANERFSLLKEAHRLILEYYLGELPEQMTLERGMIRGMVTEIGDPYTVYLEPAAFEIQSNNLSGEYGGIGAVLSHDDDGLFRLVPFEDGPAALAGVKDGDIILAIDGTPIERDAKQDEVLAMIRGPVGTSVTLTLAGRGADDAEIEVTIEREAFPIPSVTSYLLPTDERIAAIAISIFSEQTPQETERAYDELVEAGAKAVILDLRDNAGGLLESAVDTASFFLRDGIVLYELRKDGETILHRVENPGVAWEIPLAIIINEGTASSAEVVAAALQSNGRAPLIGRRTFGKGSVQSVLILQDESSLYITSARWLTPDNEILDQQGLVPDIVVPNDVSEGDAFITLAVEYIQELLRPVQ